MAATEKMKKVFFIISAWHSEAKIQFSGKNFCSVLRQHPESIWVSIYMFFMVNNRIKISPNRFRFSSSAPYDKFAAWYSFSRCLFIIINNKW